MVTKNAIGSNIPIEIAKGGTNATSFTDKGIVYYDGTSLTSTAAGTAGQVLTSNGAGSAPTFQASTVKMILVQTQTVAAVDFVSFTNMTDFTNYILMIDDLACTSTTKIFYMQVSNDNGATWKTTNYQSSFVWFNHTTALIYNVTSTTDIPLSNQTTTTYNNGLKFNLYNVNSGLPFTTNGYSIISDGSGGRRLAYYSATNSATNINAIKLYFAAANKIARGTFSLYGVSI